LDPVAVVALGRHLHNKKAAAIGMKWNGTKISGLSSMRKLRSSVMKTLYSLLATMLSIALTIPLAIAGEVTIPNTFTSGTTAKAAEVNDNFTAVKTEVDDNNLRIEAVETQTQNMDTGCPAGEAIAKIATNGTIECEADTDTTYSAGTGLNLTGTQFTIEAGDVSISAQEFDSEIISTLQVQYCVLHKGATTPYAFFIKITGATNAACDAVAGVQLPDNVVMTGLHCLVNYGVLVWLLPTRNLSTQLIQV
jgi:hypothetical protein